MKNGIDVSHWDGPIDWKKIAANKEFAFTKATEGATFQDESFEKNLTGMKENNLEAGAYHIFRMTSSPEEQRDNIINTLKKANFNPNSDRLAVSSTTGICSKPDQEKCDKPTEHSNQERAEKLAFLLSELKETGYDPIVYASPKTWNDYYVTGEHNFSSYPLWVAHWTNSDKPMIPKDWKDAGKSYDYWNNTCDGTVDGISGKVCLDRTQDDRKDILQKIAQEFSKVKDSTLDISLDFENIENYLN